MRKLALLLAVAMAAACSDQNPAGVRTKVGDGKAGDVVQTAEGIKAAQGKPADQVGFTKITKVTAPGIVSPGAVNSATAACPAGTTVIGGGYLTLSGVGIGTTPVYTTSHDDGNNGWSITALNQNPNGALSFQVYAYCIS